MSEKKKNIKIKKDKEKANIRKHPIKTTNIFNTFDDIFDDFRINLQESFLNPWGWQLRSRKPINIDFPTKEACTDIIDNGNKYLICAEAPGIPKNKIEITLTPNSIEISGEMEEKDEETKKGYIRNERSYSSIYKHLSFPEDVLPDKAEATMKDGLIEITVPKKSPTQEPKTHKLKIK